MKRYFNTTGYCRPEMHYMIDPIRGIKDHIDQLIENEQYFLIHAPRQTGKTTLLHALAKQLNHEGKYICVAFSIENAGYRSISVEKAMTLLVKSLFAMAENILPKNELPPLVSSFTPNEALLYDYLIEWCEQQTKPIVLLIDEIDSIWDDVLIATLRQLRNGFQLRPKAFPVSVALVGLRDIRDYKMKIKELDGALGSGSPFNIKAKSFMLGAFTKNQIIQLYQQYSDETGQQFSAEVIDLIYDYTGGQPWLVNAIANEIVVEILKNNTETEITVSMVETAKENLIQRRDTHLDSLTDKLQEPRVKNIIQSVINGEPFLEKTFNDDLQYVLDLGIVIDNSTGIYIANRIYSEIIPRVLNASIQKALIPIIDPLWYIKNGKLQMAQLLKGFQQFYRENSEMWLDKFSYQEAGKQLLLMAFLQRVLNGGGKINREMALGRGRTDIVVEFGGERFVLELKIRRSNYNHQNALKQLSGYLDTIGQHHGYLIIFEEKPSNQIPWEQRIKWQDTKYEQNGAMQTITIVEM